jgi:hypothetical protein
MLASLPPSDPVVILVRDLGSSLIELAFAVQRLTERVERLERQRG